MAIEVRNVGVIFMWSLHSLGYGSSKVWSLSEKTKRYIFLNFVTIGFEYGFKYLDISNDISKI